MKMKTSLIILTMNKNKYIFAVLLCALTVGYGIFQARTLIHGPTLIVLSPLPGETISGKLMSVTGNTQHVTHVQVNGKSVTIDISGKFSETLVTPEGYGTILVEAKDRFGGHVAKKIDFFGKPNVNNS